MFITKFIKNILDVFGPAGSILANAKFTTAGAGAPTVLEAMGFATIARSGVGIFLLTLAVKPKSLNVTLGSQFTTAAQTVIITGVSEAAGTIQLTVVGAGGNTAADTTGLTIHIQALLRMAN